MFFSALTQISRAVARSFRRCGNAMRRRQHATRAPLECAERLFPFAVARMRPRELLHQRSHALQLRQHRHMLIRVDEFDLAVLADPDAGPHAFDAAAAYAFPRRDAVGHGIRRFLHRRSSALVEYDGLAADVEREERAERASLD